MLADTTVCQLQPLLASSSSLYLYSHFWIFPYVVKNPVFYMERHFKKYFVIWYNWVMLKYWFKFSSKTFCSFSQFSPHMILFCFMEIKRGNKSLECLKPKLERVRDKIILNAWQLQVLVLLWTCLGLFFWIVKPQSFCGARDSFLKHILPIPRLVWL